MCQIAHCLCVVVVLVARWFAFDVNFEVEPSIGSELSDRDCDCDARAYVRAMLAFLWAHPVFTVVAVLFLGYQVYCVIQRLREPKNLPPLIRGWPLLGVALEFGRNPVEYASKLVKEVRATAQ